MNNNPQDNQNGKGDKPRSCFSKEYKDNYDLIDWGKKEKLPKRGQLLEDILKQDFTDNEN